MVLEKLQYLVECITQDLIQYLMEDNNITMEEAMDIVYNSKTFEQLNDFETHLYYESSSYVYEYLKEELKNESKSMKRLWEYIGFRKVLEEANEFGEENSIEEFGSLMEAISAIMKLKGYNMKEVEKTMKAKEEIKGELIIRFS